MNIRKKVLATNKGRHFGLEPESSGLKTLDSNSAGTDVMRSEHML